MIYKLYKSAPPEVGERTLSMWAKDWRLSKAQSSRAYYCN